LSPRWNRFTPKTLSISLWKSFALSTFTHKETHNRTLLFGTILLKHGRYFDYWSQPLNMRMRICCLDCHEAGLCCYLVIHRKPITSITAVLLQFMTDLLTLPHALEVRRKGKEGTWR
jgi:hypothetical protein